jgi:sortase A
MNKKGVLHMQKEKVVKACKSTIGTILIAIFIVIGVFLAVKICWGTEIENIFMLANKVSININKDKEQQPITIDEEKKSLDSYPEYGTQYATIEIPRIGANLPVYFGDTLEILKKGVGHSSGSYFPGEGGSILYMGHNSKKVFRRFSELQIGDEIKVTTTYGEYNYKIYDMQLIKETDLDKVPIQRDEEILMVYTCYPFNNVGYATQRYVVYAKLEK